MVDVTVITRICQYVVSLASRLGRAWLKMESGFVFHGMPYRPISRQESNRRRFFNISMGGVEPCKRETASKGVFGIVFHKKKKNDDVVFSFHLIEPTVIMNALS